MENETRENRIEKQSAGFEVSGFVKRLSYDFRTYMNTIIGDTELISRENVNSRIRGSLNNIRQATEQMTLIAEDMTDLVRILNNEIELEKSEYCFEDVMLKLRQNMEHGCAVAGIESEILVDGSIPYRMNGDSSRLTKMLNRMINDAISVTKSGKVSFSAKRMQGTKGNVFLRFDVTDSGEGVLSESVTRALGGKGADLSQGVHGVDSAAIGVFLNKYFAGRMGGKLAAKAIRGNGCVYTLLVMQETVGDTTLDDQYRLEKEMAEKKEHAEYIYSGEGLKQLEALGLNTGEALANFGGNENEYLEVLATLCRSSDTKSTMLNYYVKQHDYKSYIMTMHGILGVAQVIGAVDLANRSRELEQAAKQGKREIIENDTAAFGEAYDSLLSSVRSAIMTKDKDTRKGAIEKEDLLAIIEELEGYLTDYQINEVEELFYTLAQFSYQNVKVMELIHTAEEQMLGYNYNDVITTLEQIEAEMLNEQN